MMLAETPAQANGIEANNWAISDQVILDSLNCKKKRGGPKGPPLYRESGGRPGESKIFPRSSCSPLAQPHLQTLELFLPSAAAQSAL
jgi:hypothetical protein